MLLKLSYAICWPQGCLVRWTSQACMEAVQNAPQYAGPMEKLRGLGAVISGGEEGREVEAQFTRLSKVLSPPVNKSVGALEASGPETAIGC